MLYMAKEQSNTFDALIACQSLVMIRYLLLVYIFGQTKINWRTRPIVPTTGRRSKLDDDGLSAMGICQRADYQVK
jgi:hypothetical protein